MEERSGRHLAGICTLELPKSEVLPPLLLMQKHSAESFEISRKVIQDCLAYGYDKLAAVVSRVRLVLV